MERKPCWQPSRNGRGHQSHQPEVSTLWKMQHTLYWWHPIQPPAREFYADGSGGQRIYVDPASHMIIVQLANQSRQDFPFRKIVAYLQGEPYQYPRSIPALVRLAALNFGADSTRVTFERLTAAERETPALYVVTRVAFEAVVKELLAVDGNAGGRFAAGSSERGPQAPLGQVG